MDVGKIFSGLGLGMKKCGQVTAKKMNVSAFKKAGFFKNGRAYVGNCLFNRPYTGEITTAMSRMNYENGVLRSSLINPIPGGSYISKEYDKLGRVISSSCSEELKKGGKGFVVDYLSNGTRLIKKYLGFANWFRTSSHGLNLDQPHLYNITAITPKGKVYKTAQQIAYNAGTLSGAPHKATVKLNKSLTTGKITEKIYGDGRIR